MLIVDDTRTIRNMIRAVLEADPRFLVVGEAEDPYIARDKIKALNPDVLTLDVEMPRMNGLVFLRNLMRLRPMPVVMVSTRTSEQSEEAVTALSLGAVDCIDLKKVHGAPDIRSKLTETLLAAAGASLQKPTVQTDKSFLSSNPDYAWDGKFVLIGSSTGGVEALERVFSAYPENCPPTLVAQHMPANFLQSFAVRLNGSVAPKVSLARDGQVPKQGEVLIAPGGDMHLALSGGLSPTCQLIKDVGDQLYIPAVDVLFRSGLQIAPKVVSVMLTGMGSDGAQAMLELRQAGAQTLVQDSGTSVIDGMPRAAREIGAAGTVVPLDQIGTRILSMTRRTERLPV